MNDRAERVCRHMLRPLGTQPIDHVDLVGRSGQEGQGPFFVISLKVAGGRIEAASFRSAACPYSTATGSAMVKIVQDRTLDDARALTDADLEQELGGREVTGTSLMQAAALAAKAARIAPTTVHAVSFRRELMGVLFVKAMRAMA